VHAQADAEKQYLITLVGFYNLENLFDTIDGPNRDEEFLPDGPKHYTGDVYRDKLDHLSRVISEIGTDRSPDGLAVMGCAEVENETVLRDLVANPRLADRHYRYVHYDSPDERGIDVGLLYNPKYFKPIASKPLYVDNRNPDGTPRHTRDVLYVYGILSGDTVHLLVAHWPSRRGGEQASAPYRAQAASVCRSVIDSVMAQDAHARIILMGDLNDDPVNRSVTEVIGCVSNLENVTDSCMYNPWVEDYRRGHGTLAYRDAWNLFDQIILSGAWLDFGDDGFFFHDAVIFQKPWMLQHKGKYRGYPMRTYNWNQYMGGYSDHFPTYVVLLKELKR
jgi:hypothetical protein